MSIKKRRFGFTAGAVAVASASAVAGTLLAAGPAVAQPGQPYGTVTTDSGVNVRKYPSKDSSVVGGYAHNERFGLDCKVRAQNINHNAYWYLLRDGSGWVTARYVKNTGGVKLCKDAHPTAQTNSMQAHHAKG